MAKKDTAPKAAQGPKSGLLDKVTTLIMLLFFCTLALGHLH